MRILNGLITAAMAMAVTTIAEPELSGTPTELIQHLRSIPEKVVISGVAERTVEADRAVIKILVLTTEKKLEQSLIKNNKIRTDIMQQLTASGIDTNRIHTSRFASSPIHSSWSGKIKEYVISSRVNIYAENEKEMQSVALLVDKFEEVSLSSISFEMTKKEKIKQELIKEALQQVQQHKEIYESSLGVDLIPAKFGPDFPGSDSDLAIRGGIRKGNRFTSYDNSILSNPELTVTLHALMQQAPAIDQFEELLYKAEITVTFHLFNKDKNSR